MAESENTDPTFEILTVESTDHDDDDDDEQWNRRINWSISN